MAPPPLNPTLRYFPPGVRRFYWLTAIASTAAPTRAELDAGIDLTGEIDTMAGWQTTAPAIDFVDFGARFAGQIPGRLTLVPSAITFWLSQNSIDIRRVLSRRMAGFMVALWEGDVAGQPMDVFPVKVADLVPDAAIENAATITVSFDGSSKPAIGVPVPVGIPGVLPHLPPFPAVPGFASPGRASPGIPN